MEGEVGKEEAFCGPEQFSSGSTLRKTKVSGPASLEISSRLLGLSEILGCLPSRPCLVQASL